MDLLCEERVSPGSDGAPRPAPAPRAAASDPVLLRRRVLDNLLRTEERYAVTANYFGTLQTEITPHMRRIVAEWMLEVCEDQSCQEEVFPLAISYLDRFLSICTVGKSQLQLLGTACLLLASKLREPGSRGLPAELLVFYTANSITLADLCETADHINHTVSCTFCIVFRASALVSFTPSISSDVGRRLSIREIGILDLRRYIN
ncbi:unnamed protein product, partial [Iphiclides podalirius]